jgi:hypothetical protein
MTKSAYIHKWFTKIPDVDLFFFFSNTFVYTSNMHTSGHYNQGIISAGLLVPYERQF